MGELYDQLCTPQLLFEAWHKVARKKGCTGVDSQSIREFEQRTQKNILQISEQLQQGQYEPAPLRAAQIPKETKGQFRRLGIPTVRDRIVFQAVNMLLQRAWNNSFSSLSFAYKCGTGVTDAISTAARLIRQKRFWFVKGDIHGCFDELNWDILSARLQEWLPDDSLRRLINKGIRVPSVSESRINTRYRGVPQGSPVSPILANLYLYPFDCEMLRHRYPLIRYADDWLILTRSEGEATEAFFTARAQLSTLLIQMNQTKSGIGDLNQESVIFLGHKIDAHRIDAGPKGWRRFADALTELKRARTESEITLARSKLSGLRSFFRNAGIIERKAQDQSEDPTYAHPLHHS